MLNRTIRRKRHAPATFAMPLLMLAVALQGCVAGMTKDADSDGQLSGVIVDSYGYCSGRACLVAADAPNGRGREVTSTSPLWTGAFIFDAYGDLSGASRVQLIAPGTNTEAIRFVVTPNNGQHQSRTLYYRPKYWTYKSELQGNTYGKDYTVSTVPTVYLCRNGSPDSDSDGVCDPAESRYGTNPNLVNSDGDAFSDSDELFGLASEGVDLQYYGASATHKDVFVYVDYYKLPSQAALDRVKQAFAAAPLSNPDGVGGINLHIIMGKQIAAADQVLNFSIGEPGRPVWDPRYDQIKAKYFPRALARVAHYALFGHGVNSNSGSGFARGIPSHDFLITLGLWSTPYGTEVQQAGTFMHELGHSLGLQHGGHEPTNNKPNYLSLMSYTYQGRGLRSVTGQEVLDYSRFQIRWLNENSLSEIDGMTPAAPNTTEAMLSQYLMMRPNWGPIVAGNCSGPLNFNGDSVFPDSGTVSADLDRNGQIGDTFSDSWNDWDHLLYQGSATGGGVIGGDLAKALVPQIVTVSQMPPELTSP